MAIAAGTGGISAALIAACSGESNQDGSTEGAPSAGQPATATAALASKPGGIFRTLEDEDVATFDPLAARAAITNTIAGFAYSRLLKFKLGEGRFADGILEADAATGWEQIDETTTVLRLRDGMKFDQRSPTNGRALNAEDVTLSWEKFAASAAYRGDLARTANPGAPVLSFQATDARTITIKTAYPDAQLLPSMNFWGGLWILPAEGFDGGFDPATTMRGSGPWTLERHQASVGFSFKKNPNYYGAPAEPLLDGIEAPIITDAAQAAAQFKAKNLHGGSPSAVPTTDIVSFFRDLGGTRIDVEAPPVAGPTISFSWRESNPFRDKRVRHAMSMLIDRDAYIDLFYDLRNFASTNVEMHAYWNTPLSAGWGPFWLDPKSDAFGPNAKYLKRDVAEAKKLLAAAGHPDGFETDFTFLAGSNYGRDWGQRAEALMSMLSNGGIRCRANAVDYQSVWIPSYLRNQGDFDGVAMYPNGSRGDPGQWLHVFFTSTGANNQVAKNFPALDDLVAKQRQELDQQKRIAIVHEIQRYFASEMPTIPQGGNTEQAVLSWNGLHGPDHLFRWEAGPNGAEAYPRYWLDDSLRR